MGFWKMTPFLALGIVFLINMSILQAAPISTEMETTSNPENSLEEEEVLTQLAEKVKAYNLMMEAGEMLKNGAEEHSVQKRSCITATCLLHTLLQTLSANENMGKSPLLPYNMGFKVYDGRHKFHKN